MIRSQIVKNLYSTPEVVKEYTKVGLFPAEEKLVERFFIPESRVLDIGCGAGRTSIPLAKKGYKLVGIDISSAMISAANFQASFERMEIEFIEMDAVVMTFPACSFDNVIFSFNGFQAIPGRKNRDKVLKDIFRILRPGGIFILTFRSGIAPGKRMVGWVYMLMLYPYRKLFYEHEIEIGDHVRKGKYNHYICPFALKKRCLGLGYELKYFNSEKNIESKIEPNWSTNFSNDRMLFCVFKKGKNVTGKQSEWLEN